MLSSLLSSLSIEKPILDPDVRGFSPSSPSTKEFFHAVMEGFLDGVMVLTQQGEFFHVNQRALELCNLLGTEACQKPESLPPCLWSVCEQLIEGRDVFPDHNLVLTQTLGCIERRSVRVRVQWLELDTEADLLLLVMLEDQTETAKAAALLDSVRFGLTSRETEVWILRSINYSYEEVAAELFITLNTVKRHMKSIYAKRREVLGDFLEVANA